LGSLFIFPPVLVAVSSDSEAAQNLPVVPDRSLRLRQQFVFGVHGGQTSFDFTQDAGRSWASSNISVADWGNVAGIAVPVFHNAAPSTAFTLPDSYHDLGSIYMSSSSSGWTRRNVTTVFVDKLGQLSSSSDQSRTVTFSGIPSPGINSTVSQANPQRMYGMVRLADGTYVTAVAIIWNGLAANPFPDGPIIPWSLVAFASNDTFHWDT